jgi:hypothetical protein
MMEGINVAHVKHCKRSARGLYLRPSQTRKIVQAYEKKEAHIQVNKLQPDTKQDCH